VVDTLNSPAILSVPLEVPSSPAIPLIPQETIVVDTLNSPAVPSVPLEVSSSPALPSVP
jgi:hypothetical protein